MHMLACLFRQRNHPAEKQLLIFGKETLFAHPFVAGIGTFDDLHRHHHQVLLPGMREFQGGAHMIEIVVVSHGTKRIAGPDVHCFIQDLLLWLKTEWV
jgi:hypothetical protein